MLVFPFVNVLYHIDLHMLKHPCDSGINLDHGDDHGDHDLIMVYDTFLYCWILFANILFRIFAFIVTKDIGL